MVPNHHLWPNLSYKLQWLYHGVMRTLFSCYRLRSIHLASFKKTCAHLNRPLRLQIELVHRILFWVSTEVLEISSSNKHHNLQTEEHELVSTWLWGSEHPGRWAPIMLWAVQLTDLDRPDWGILVVMILFFQWT